MKIFIHYMLNTVTIFKFLQHYEFWSSYGDLIYYQFVINIHFFKGVETYCIIPSLWFWITNCFKTFSIFQMAIAFMLAFTNGLPRIMSSYFWERNWVNGVDLNSWEGPPHDQAFNITNFRCWCLHKWLDLWT